MTTPKPRFVFGSSPEIRELPKQGPTHADTTELLLKTHAELLATEHAPTLAHTRIRELETALEFYADHDNKPIFYEHDIGELSSALASEKNEDK